MPENNSTRFIGLLADILTIITSIGAVLVIVGSLFAWFFAFPVAPHTLVQLVATYWRPLALGIVTTLSICGIAIFLGTLFGLVIGYWLSRSTRGRLAKFARAIVVTFVYVFLCIPLFVLLLFLYHSNYFSIINEAGIATIALIINLTPFAAKIFAAGLKSISAEQIENARIAGYQEGEVWLKFRLPLLVKSVGQPLLVQYITTLKLSALASYIGVAEIFHAGQAITRDTYAVYESYLIVAVVYIIIILPMLLAADRFESKARLTS